MRVGRVVGAEMKRSGRNRTQPDIGIQCPVVTGVQNPDFLCLKLPLEPPRVGDMAADAFCMPRGLGGKAPEEKGLLGIVLPHPPVSG